jgi:hypothetical protein
MWNDENIKALSYLVDELTNENRITLSWFRKFKSKSLLTRVYAFFYSDIRRQTFWGNVALFIGLVLKKI